MKKERITDLLDEEIEFAKGTGMPQFVMGLQQAKKIIIAEWNKSLCDDCEKEDKNPGLDVCGECYHKRIWGEQ